MRDKKTQTLPVDSKERKNYPLLAGVIRYFPAALAGVALVSKLGNDKHNPGEALHHARGKSTDHGDCIIRHLIDLQDLLAGAERSAFTPYGIENALTEVSSLAWRALALSQELHEQYGAPLAPGAKEEVKMLANNSSDKVTITPTFGPVNTSSNIFEVYGKKKPNFGEQS